MQTVYVQAFERRFVVCALWSLLAACGGGGGGDSAPASAAAGAPASAPAAVASVPSSAPAPAQSPSSSPAPAASAPTTAIETASKTCDLPNFQAALLAKINQYRARGVECGSNMFAPAPALVWNDLLSQASLAHSLDMKINNFVSHVGSDGLTFGQRIDVTGYVYTAAGENVAAGQTTVDSVMTAWIESPGHCANIMNSSFKDVGFTCTSGNAQNTYPTYWTMNFGAR
jgi:uncharacterized protein YkwD